MIKDRRKCKICVFIITSMLLIMGMAYLSWRWLYTLNLFTSPFATFWSYALLGAEIITFLVFTNFCMILIKAASLKKVLIDNELQQDYYKDVFHDGTLVTFKNFCPSVDIFICTLNESADMLSTTISACKNIDYPNHKVYVLDDGRREEIKELTKMLGCNYITRDTNKGYKAGNINNALALTDSEIVVIFDADHIPASTFLRETVYNFVDEKVALVQTPQHFCNPDAFQKNLRMEKFLMNEQDMFYRIIEPSLNEYGSVFCGGTNILLKRKLLQEVGGFPETTITEDSLLGLIFHSHGYKVVYYNRPIAIGIAASSFDEYIKQRCRWAKGNLQIIKNPQNWGYYLKIKPIQLFFYVSGVLYFLTPVARLIYLFAPVLFLFFDIAPLLALFYQILAFQICYFAIKFAFIFFNNTGNRNFIMADVYDLVTSVFTIGSIIQTLIIPNKFAKFKFLVTNKDTFKMEVNHKYLVVILFLFVLVLAAQLQGIYDLLYSDVYSQLAVVANLFWNSTNLIVLYFALHVVSEKPEKRVYQRIVVNKDWTLEDIKHHKIHAYINDISRSGLSFSVSEALSEENHDYKINIDGEENDIEVLGCENTKGQITCKSIFKTPMAIYKLTKQIVNRLDRFVKFTYKSPDFWDDYFNNKKK